MLANGEPGDEDAFESYTFEPGSRTDVKFEYDALDYIVAGSWAVAAVSGVVLGLQLVLDEKSRARVKQAAKQGIVEGVKKLWKKDARGKLLLLMTSMLLVGTGVYAVASNVHQEKGYREEFWKNYSERKGKEEEEDKKRFEKDFGY